MSALTKEQALENIYQSLHNNNEAIDAHIAALKLAIAPSKEVTVDTSRLAQTNREGRKMMERYFQKRGVTVNFETKSA